MFFIKHIKRHDLKLLKKCVVFANESWTGGTHPASTEAKQWDDFLTSTSATLKKWWKHSETSGLSGRRWCGTFYNLRGTHQGEASGQEEGSTTYKTTTQGHSLQYFCDRNDRMSERERQVAWPCGMSRNAFLTWPEASDSRVEKWQMESDVTLVLKRQLSRIDLCRWWIELWRRDLNEQRTRKDLPLEIKPMIWRLKTAARACANHKTPNCQAGVAESIISSLISQFLFADVIGRSKFQCPISLSSRLPTYATYHCY